MSKTVTASAGTAKAGARDAAPQGGIDAADGGSNQSRTDADRAFTLCASLLRTGHPDAMTVLDQCLDRHSEDAAGWRLLGDTLAGLLKFQAALVCFERSRRGAPTSDVAIRIGTTLQALGRHTPARIAFAEAAALEPRSVRARFLEGVAAQDSGDSAGAIQAYERALTLDPTSGEAALNLGTVRQETGDLAGARRAFGIAMRLRPDGFARAAQALTTARAGELWLDLGALRQSLADSD